MADETDAARTMKRRGILAAAAAVMAGIVAKGTSQPVRAATDTSFTATGGVTNFDARGTTSYALDTISGTFSTAVYARGTSYGVYGTSVTNASSIGVQGYTGNVGIGVYGINDHGYAVNGVCTGSGYGVYGVSQSLIGVYGSSAQGTGVYGQTTASNQYGVLGTTYAANSTAIAGTCTQNGSSAFSGGTANPNAFAAFFQGTTVVQGNFAVTGTKSAVIQHPRTGDHRLVYCVESPEAWFEDFGEGTLVAGQARVTLDPDFAALIHTDAYHVFLTTYGTEGNGLNVSERRAEAFTVQERSQGTSGGRFSWRVVGKRVDTKSERLGKFTMPTIPLPDPAKFPQPKATPPSGPPLRTDSAPAAKPPLSASAAAPPTSGQQSPGGAPNPLPAPRP